MPKHKTHRGAAKRLRKTATGKIVHRSAFGRHKAEHKSSTRKRRVTSTSLISDADVRRARKMLEG